MGKSRMLGAGNASSSLYRVNPNTPTGGGSKKQGVTSRVGLGDWSNRDIQIRSNGAGRFGLYYGNRLGGVGVGRSMFGGPYTHPGGAHTPVNESAPTENTLLIVVRAINAPGPGAYTITFTNDGSSTFISGFNGLDVSNVSVVHLRVQLNQLDDLFFPAFYANGGLVIPALNNATLSADVTFENQNLSNSLVQLNAGGLSAYVEGPYFVISTPSPLECPHFNITLPIDYFELETCTAFVHQIYIGTPCKYYYTAAVSLMNYPNEAAPAACSLIC